jgi:hypothetical protein
MMVEYVRVSQASTGMTVISVMNVRIIMDAPTIIASIQLTQLSLNSSNVSIRHPLINISALTKAMVMSSIVVSRIIVVKKLE